MKIIRKLVLLTSLLSLLLAPLQVFAKELIDQVLEKGELRVAVSVMAPWVMKDKQGEYIGFEIDVAHQLASDMGVKAVFKEYEWDEMIPALLNNEVDIIASGLSITPKRALKVAFSAPYSSSGYNIVSNLKLTKDFKSIKDLNSAKVYIAVVKGTVSAGLANKIFPLAKIEEYKDPKEASSAVVNGTVHAFVSSSPTPSYVVLSNPDEVDLPLEKPLLTTREAFAINRGNQEMLNYLNSWITAHTADEWIRSSHKFWFKSLKWRHRVAGNDI
jgi:polar amino acid transport system substrate-binding protein